MSADRPRGTSARYFAGLAEATFVSRLGVADPSLTDYIADLLIRFIRCDVLYRLRRPTGQRLAAVVEMLSEAQQRIGPARREAHRHVGDFTLFWTGVYPEALRTIQGVDRQDHLIDYQAQGKKAYYIASRIPSAPTDPGGEVLERLSDEFELYAYGLGEIRRQWEEDEAASGELWVD